MDAMILAAGRGQRMRPLTDKMPKPLIRVGNHPLIEHHLHSLYGAGFRKVIINVSYLSEKIIDHIGSGDRFGVDIEYSEEPGGPYGTAAGIRHALPLIRTNPFLVINSDIFTRINPKSLECPDGSPAHLVLVPNPSHNQGGDFRLQHDKIELLDQDNGDPGLTYSGIGIYTRDIFKNSKLDEAELGAMIRTMLTQGYAVTGELREEPWIDVGTVERLDLARRCASEESMK